MLFFDVKFLLRLRLLEVRSGSLAVLLSATELRKILIRSVNITIFRCGFCGFVVDVLSVIKTIICASKWLFLSLTEHPQRNFIENFEDQDIHNEMSMEI